MQRRNVWFPDPLAEEGERVAKERDLKFADVVRKALEEYLEKIRHSRGAK